MLEPGRQPDHLVCVYCGNVEEFFDHVAKAQQKVIASKHNFQLLEHTMAQYGMCSAGSCQAKHVR